MDGSGSIIFEKKKKTCMSETAEWDRATGIVKTLYYSFTISLLKDSQLLCLAFIDFQRHSGP